MSNMSYCRFQNTEKDFADCMSALEDLANGQDRLSDDELRAAKSLATRALDMVRLLAENTDLQLSDVMDSDLEDEIQRMQDDAVNEDERDEDEERANDA